MRTVRREQLMRNFTLYTTNTVGNAKNSVFPQKIVIADKSSFLEAIQFDHVTAEYKDNYRKGDNFIQADVLPMDCDNDHSENPKDWVEPFDVSMAFPNVAFVVTYSRNHNKVKGGKVARPRFHVYFPIDVIHDKEDYTATKQAVHDAFPYFDNNAKDAARLLFGTGDTDVEIYEGGKTITDFLNEDLFAEWDNAQGQITEGNRNNAMSQLAGKLIKRYGNTDSSKTEFLKLAAEKCEPALSNEELSVIWNSAVSFGNKISKQEGYIAPELFNSDCALKPTDYSDVGQATVLAREYNGKLRFSPATKFLVFNGSYWEESEPKAQAVIQELTERQLEEAEVEVQKQIQVMTKNGAFALLASLGPKKAQAQFNRTQQVSFDRYSAALEYEKFAIKRRDSKYISSGLKESQPMLELDPKILDKDAYLLNTPSHTYDLKTGKAKTHDSMDFITKQTLVDPSDNGMELWIGAVNGFFTDDKDLVDYIQANVGMAFIGKVLKEALLIAYGEGGNGKSTFWNVIAKVCGTYSGTISADILTVGCRRNVKPELAEAKGKRLLIAAELQEGMRLSTANVKQLCSTDEITAEKKFKDPFSYTPTHTLVLYTNHLPKVGASDDGTWRRLIVVPFTEKISKDKDIKNYADYLYQNAGGAILKWIMEGAKRAIELDYHIPVPEKVQKAIQEYKASNDWFGHFLEECCEIDDGCEQKSGEFYTEYRAYCARTGEYTRNTSDFYSAVEQAGFVRKKVTKGVFIYGLRLKSDFEM